MSRRRTSVQVTVEEVRSWWGIGAGGVLGKAAGLRDEEAWKSQICVIPGTSQPLYEPQTSHLNFKESVGLGDFRNLAWDRIFSFFRCFHKRIPTWGGQKDEQPGKIPALSRTPSKGLLIPPGESLQAQAGGGHAAFRPVRGISGNRGQISGGGQVDGQSRGCFLLLVPWLLATPITHLPLALPPPGHSIWGCPGCDLCSAESLNPQTRDNCTPSSPVRPAPSWAQRVCFSGHPLAQEGLRPHTPERGNAGTLEDIGAAPMDTQLLTWAWGRYVSKQDVMRP